MEKKMMKSNGAGSRSSAMKRRRLLSAAAVLLAVCLAFVGAAGADGNVAKVGDTEYATIDDAITAWTAGTTLTLLSDVTLSDVVKLKSTEHHILNLGTYTMTAASGKNAIEILSYGLTSEHAALSIKADETNPGGINANSKSCIYYKYDDTLTTANDRPNIYIYGGVFTSSGDSGISSTGYITSDGKVIQKKCATFNIQGGTFNCVVNLIRTKLLISGGTFNQEVSCTGANTAYRLISGGTFSSFGTMSAHPNAPKAFTIGNAQATYDNGVYVDDNGYLIVGGPVITSNNDDKFEAKADDGLGWSEYLAYSSAAEYGLYYTDLTLAINKNSGKNLDLFNATYENKVIRIHDNKELIMDMTDISNKELTVTLGEGDSRFIVTYPEGTSIVWAVSRKDGKTLTGSTSVDNGVVTHTYANLPVIIFVNEDDTELQSCEVAYGETPSYTGATPTKDSDAQYTYTHLGWTPEIAPVTGDAKYTATYSSTLNEYTIDFVDEDGTVLWSSNFVYGATPSYTGVTPTKDGYTFRGWAPEIPETMPANNLVLTAVWDVPNSQSSGGDGIGGALSFPRTTTNGGLVDFGSSKVIKAVLLPEGSSGSVLLKVDTVEKWPKALETEYTFDISVEKLGDGMAYIHFEIPGSVLESLELTPADICAYHFEGEVWTKLPTTYEVKDGTVCYEAETDSFSPFKLVIEEGAATQKEEENVPTVPPTEEPDVPDEPEILPPIDEPAKPTEPETPAPILAVLAGLGAAFIVRRK